MSLDGWDGTAEGGQQEERGIKGLREKGEAGSGQFQPSWSRVVLGLGEKVWVILQAMWSP